MSNRNYENQILDDSIDITEDQPVVKTDEEKRELYGVVTNCLRLNIRKTPDKDSEVVVIATCLDELRVDPTASTDDWYAVCTASGMEGFCMKKFVAIRQ